MSGILWDNRRLEGIHGGGYLSVRARLGKAVRQASCILALGTALGIGYHEVRFPEIPWVGTWSAESVAARHLEGLSEISVEEAWEAHLAGKVLFLDARDPGSFASGHLPSALNVPPSEASSMAQEIRALAEAGMVPVAYCDGADCPLSAELARALSDLGVRGVRVLVNGWSRWGDAGYPVEEGGQ